jgi:hypothetical protein
VRAVEEEVTRLHAEQARVFDEMQSVLERWVHEQEGRLLAEQETFRSHVQQFAADKFGEYEAELHRDVARDLQIYEENFRQQVMHEQAVYLQDVLEEAADRYEYVCAKLDTVTHERDKLLEAGHAGFW